MVCGAVHASKLEWAKAGPSLGSVRHGFMVGEGVAG